MNELQDRYLPPAALFICPLYNRDGYMKKRRMILLFLMISLFIGWVLYVDFVPNARSFDIEEFDRIHGTSFHDKDYFSYKEDRFTLRDLYYEYYFFSGRLSLDAGYSNVTVVDRIMDLRETASAYPLADHIIGHR